MKCYKAKWIFTSNGQILEDMALVVDEGKFVDIIPQSAINFEEKYIKDYGNSVITPGFIDLLTQYQFTDIINAKPESFRYNMKKFFKTLALKYNFAGVSQNSYSRKWAFILSKYFTLDRSQKINSFKHGVTESIKAGTTCIAQVSKEFKYFETINKLPIKNYLFFEVFADTKDNSKKTFKILKSKVEDFILHKAENTHIGIMLNSISGVHRKLWTLFSKYCRKHNMLMMTRFAESKDEIDWLEHGFSDIDLLHKFMGMRKISPYSKGLSPIEYLDNLKVLTKKVLIANANFCELDKLAETGVKLIYQPLYNKEICDKNNNFQDILKYYAGNFGLSTQSFENNRNYSLLKLASDLNKDGLIDLQELIKYLTIYPAKILRLDNSIGSIEIGKDADFNVFKLKENENFKAILNSFVPYAVYSKGHKLVKNGEVRFSL